MARFDVYRNPEGSGYLLDVQADLLSDLNTRVVVPLIPAELAPPPATRLNPVFSLEATRVVMVTQFLSAVPLAMLVTPVASLADRDAEILAALDMVLTGF